ncbi:hypothetical protein K438DRAFT_1779133 [Mycena galopus ATCC 62051]|nr:hypothetical protein K438DRAFT_1779133 [Mycena galopus ATCC 62051]
MESSKAGKYSHNGRAWGFGWIDTPFVKLRIDEDMRARSGKQTERVPNGFESGKGNNTPSASAESFVYAGGVSQLTRSGGSASHEGGSQLTHSEGGLMLLPTRSLPAVIVSSSSFRALSSAVGASDLFGAAEASTGERRLTGGEEVSAVSRGVSHEGGIGGGRIGASGEEPGRTISAGAASADKCSYSVFAP